MRQRRASFNSESFVPFSNVSKGEQLELGMLFKKADLREGGISFYDFIEIIKTMIEINQTKKSEILKDITNKGVKILDFNFLLSTVSTLKKEKELNLEQKLPSGEYFDTFVALGGNADGSGYITKSNLITTMKNEFGIDVDLDTLDIKNSVQEKLNFDEFCEIFQNPESTLLRSDSAKTIVINEQDFKNYLSKLPE